MKILKWTISVLLTITAPIWVIPAFIAMGILSGAKDLHEILWGK